MQSDFAVFRRSPLLRCLAIYCRMPLLFLSTAILFVLVNAGLAWQQWLVGRAVDDVTHGRAAVYDASGLLDDSVASHWFAILVTIALVRGLLQYLTTMASQQCNQRLLTILRARIFDQIQHLDLAYHRSHGMGELVTRTTRDADKVRDALVTFWRQGLETVLVVVATIGLLAWYHPLLALVPLLLTLAGLTIFALQIDRLVALDRQVGAAYDEVNQDLSEGIVGVRVIKSFVLEEARIARFTQQVGKFMHHARTALAYASTRIPLPQVVVAMSHAWILVYGAILVQRGQIALGALTASLLIATSLVFRLEGISRAMQAFADARSSAQRIWDLLDAQPAVISGTYIVPDGSLGIRLSQVGVRAPGADVPILDDCNLEVKPGEVLALVGATGSGKSTLANLLPHLLQTERGTVTIGSEKVGWHEIRRFSLASLRRRVHVVPQDSFLFSDTISANLRLGAPDANDAELWAALRTVRMDEAVAGLPHGLETPLGDQGVTLSGGQRQRLCLARALLSAPSILVLDDATSALDAVTERAILDAIRHRSHPSGQAGATRQTVLLITGKLSAVLFADRVAVLHQGRIDAIGTHAELTATHALYRDLLGLDHG